MITLDWLKEKLAPLVKTKEADKVGIVFFHTGLQVSRFANSQIHQHMADEDRIVSPRVLLDGRIGIASTNSIDEHNLKETFKKALSIARLKLESKEKKDIPSFKPLKASSAFWFPQTAHTQAPARIKLLKRIFSDGNSHKPEGNGAASASRSHNLAFSGNLYNGLTQLGVVSPEGRVNYQDYSFAGLKLIASSGESSGYAHQAGYSLESLNVKEVADIAIKKCLMGHKKLKLKPARYDVILEPAAVAELIAWLNYIGFGAKSVFEETGFLYKRSGKRVTGEPVSIYDYGSDAHTFVLPFDFEGRARKKTYLIKKGIAGSPLCDSHYAKLLKVKPSGHANFPDDIEGPLGYNLVMEGGSVSENEMVHSARQAILITRFHYINGFLDTRRALMTGMTRDGTFLIKDGKVRSAVFDLRFTESVLEAFKRIKYISKERKLIADHLETLGSVYAPSVYIKDFNFTS